MVQAASREQRITVSALQNTLLPFPASGTDDRHEHEIRKPIEMPDDDVDDIWELGVMRIFGRHDISPRSLISGWAQPEDQHVWNNGLEAVLQITIPNPWRPITLSLECTPFIWEDCPQQEVTLFVNGIREQFWRLTEARMHILDATIDPDHLIDHGSHALLTCVWLLPNSARPTEVGASPDMRELALCFQAMTIS